MNKIDRATSWNKNNPEKVKIFNMLGVLKRKCQKDGVDYDLDAEWLREKVEGVCEKTAMPFDMHTPNGPFLPAIKRRSEEGGYTKKNCMVVINLYSIADCDETLYRFCKQYVLMYDILHNTTTRKFPGV